MGNNLWTFMLIIDTILILFLLLPFMEISYNNTFDTLGRAVAVGVASEGFR